MSTGGVQHFSDTEVGRVMDQLQQLLEAGVVALILNRGDGHIVLAIPDGVGREVFRSLSADEWAQLRQVVIDHEASRP